MAKKVPIGVDNFAKIVEKEREYLFVDKTLMIRDFINNGSEVSLMIRPRRWGKTLNMSMLRYFFASEVDGVSTKGMFDNLNIAKEENGKYLKQQGMHPVIFISFKDIKQDSWEVFFEKIVELIARVYREHEKIIIKSTELTESQKTIYKKMLDGTGNQAQLETSLKFLSECLYSHYGKKVIILIDEYDTPLNAAYDKAYFEKVVNFFKGIFGSSLKSNNALEKGAMTGVLRLSKNKMLSDINNLYLYSFIEKQYSPYFGFSEEEITVLFAESGVRLKLDDVKHWYNGYRAGDLTTLYNPWSILNCIQNTGDLRPYWIKTGDESILQELFKNTSKTTEDKITTLLEGGSIESIIDDYVSFDEVRVGHEKVLWSLLWTTGYLKFVHQPTVSEIGSYVGLLAIPNHEVSCSYRAVFPKWIRAFNRIKYDSFLSNLVSGNLDTFVKNLREYMLSIPSWFDFPNESCYHSFLLGLTLSLKETHHIRSNREDGLGRADILLMPKDTNNNLGIILEFKQEDPGKDMSVYQAAADKGFKQINDNKYDATLKTEPNITRILKLCVIFYGKQFAYKSAIEQL